MLDSSQPKELLATILSAMESGSGYQAVLNHLPVPVYTTDADGRVTYWNQACVNFAGRVPQLGQDRWCVTWRLLTVDGDDLPHDRCATAQAIKEKRAVTDEIAIAVRPDGTRAAFRSYPTPLFDDAGIMTGSANMLIDVSTQQASSLKDQASRCRRLAKSTNDRQASDMLRNMAEDYERTADTLQR
jgi:PAS domain S-box-containing protein